MNTVRTSTDRKYNTTNKSHRAEENSNWIKVNKQTTLQWFNSRLDEAEEWISDLEDREVKLTQTEQQKEKKKKKEFKK